MIHGLNQAFALSFGGVGVKFVEVKYGTNNCNKDNKPRLAS